MTRNPRIQEVRAGDLSTHHHALEREGPGKRWQTFQVNAVFCSEDGLEIRAEFRAANGVCLARGPWGPDDPVRVSATQDGLF